MANQFTAGAATGFANAADKYADIWGRARAQAAQEGWGTLAKLNAYKQFRDANGGTMGPGLPGGGLPGANSVTGPTSANMNPQGGGPNIAGSQTIAGPSYGDMNQQGLRSYKVDPMTGFMTPEYGFTPEAENAKALALSQAQTTLPLSTQEQAGLTAKLQDPQGQWNSWMWGHQGLIRKQNLPIALASVQNMNPNTASARLMALKNQGYLNPDDTQNTIKALPGMPSMPPLPNIPGRMAVYRNTDGQPGHINPGDYDPSIYTQAQTQGQ